MMTMTNIVYVGIPPVDADLSGWQGEGWYFQDEAYGLNGPYASEKEAQVAFQVYCQMMLGHNK
jgi:hypothetical protein